MCSIASCCSFSVGNKKLLKDYYMQITHSNSQVGPRLSIYLFFTFSQSFIQTYFTEKLSLPLSENYFYTKCNFIPTPTGAQIKPNLILR